MSFQRAQTKLADKVGAPQLREKAEADTEIPPDSSVGVHESSDPINQLEEITDACATPSKKRKVYTSKRGKNNITKIEVPEFEPTCHPNRVEMRTITLLALSTN